jgi:hypothetical protein
MPEATRLAGTIEKWWPEIEGFLELDKMNALDPGLQPGHQTDQTRRLWVR